MKEWWSSCYAKKLKTFILTNRYLTGLSVETRVKTPMAPAQCLGLLTASPLCAAWCCHVTGLWQVGTVRAKCCW